MTTPISRRRFDAVLFDMDGVLTDTAGLHAESWKSMFDAYFLERLAATGQSPAPFEIPADYLRHVDGRLRYDGVSDLLRSRGIELPWGSPGDPPTAETVCGLGNRKNELVHQLIAKGGVRVYPGSLALARRLKRDGFRIAVVSASHNVDSVLAAAGVGHLFPDRIDGNLADRQGMAGKPAPDAFLAAAKMLNVEPGRAVVVEDAIAGVQAGRAGGFGLVIGVDRHGAAGALRAGGADVVVADLEELLEQEP